MTDRPLTPKQQAFVAAYVGEARGNATQAARLAGYQGSDNTLAVTGHDLLSNPKIQSALTAFRETSQADAILSAQEMAVWLSAVVMGQVMETDVVSHKGKADAESDDFVEVERKPKVRDRVTAAVALAKIRGYEAPAKSEVAMTATLAPETEDRLIAYLRSKR